MRAIAKRFFMMGVLFLLTPIWTFPFLDGITTSIINQREKTQSYGIIGYDFERFRMENRTDYYLYQIGMCLAFPSACVLGIYKIKDELEKRRLMKQS